MLNKDFSRVPSSLKVVNEAGLVCELPVVFPVPSGHMGMSKCSTSALHYAFLLARIYLGTLLEQCNGLIYISRAPASSFIMALLAHSPSSFPRLRVL